ncbi:MLO-like protein 6 [Vitis vinifera]|uniref:MLO-like protein n=1 Tax=Vitis vinifera TaxID=29760 RepID=A0A438IPS5_VITVI|nr:MLO-like protein 6 [Vitis vinifera]
MAKGSKDRSLEQTPTWAVAVVCFVLVLISIIIEYILHLIGKWLTKRNKRALYEALEKIKTYATGVHIAAPNGRTRNYCGNMHIREDCSNLAPMWKKQEIKYVSNEEDYGKRRLLEISDSDGSNRRVLAAAGDDKCGEGKVPFVSNYGIHQLHIFIFVLAVFHVLYCIITLALGRAKMRKWKAWEMETRTAEYRFANDPERFRFARDTSFGRRHLHSWSTSPVLLWIVCFFRQFVRSVPKVDYLTLRHGFITAHLAPESHTRFDFQKYIKRSLEEDFKVVVGIRLAPFNIKVDEFFFHICSPIIWFCAVIFLLFNTHGWHSYLWLPFIPLIIILMVGTKLQVIITKMGLRIQERGEVVKGTPVVEPGDDLFWFNQPRLILYLINFVLFQNAFQVAFFAWTWYEFGLKSCFHERIEDVVIRISMGVIVQILCSYVTLPLYALVTQMGSTMKPTIFNDRVAKALRNWHHAARKHIKQSKQSSAVTPVSSRAGTPFSSRPGTPLHGMSPVHLLRHHRSELDSVQTSPRMSNFDNEGPETDEYRHREDISWSEHHRNPGPEEEGGTQIIGS